MLVAGVVGQGHRGAAAAGKMRIRIEAGNQLFDAVLIDEQPRSSMKTLAERTERRVSD